jgi:hypothetical protein
MEKKIMSIQELHNYKSALELKIEELIHQAASDTGCVITNVDCSFVEPEGFELPRSVIHNVKVTMEIP